MIPGTPAPPASIRFVAGRMKLRELSDALSRSGAISWEMSPQSAPEPCPAVLVVDGVADHCRNLPCNGVDHQGAVAWSEAR